MVFKCFRSELNDLIGYSADLWSYNLTTTTNSWCWIAGENSGNMNGVYGTMDAPDVNNFPGGRRRMSMVFNPSVNVLYIFGGYGYPGTVATAGLYCHFVGCLNTL